MVYHSRICYTFLIYIGSRILNSSSRGRNRNDDNELEEDEPEEEQEDEQEESEEPNEFVENIKGLTEKQLLKLLVLMEYEKEYEAVTDDWNEMIKIVKEDEKKC